MTSGSSWRGIAARADEMIAASSRSPVPRVIRGRLDSDSEFALVRKWLDLNSDVLVDYWNGVIAYTEDVMDTLTAR